ncbi:MAG: hypothetical protein AB7I79_20235 [Rhizobiaceae bacterium]
MTSLRTTIAAALLAAGTLASSFVPAQADPSFGIYFDGSGGGGLVFGDDDVEIGVGFGPGGGGLSIDAAKCTKSEALGKAASMGIYNRSIKKVTTNYITVGGKLAGDHVRLIVKRKTHHCAVKNFYYV